MNTVIHSKGDQRRHKMMELLKKQGSITIAQIIGDFECSEATARRDLELLESSGSIIRTLGGAIYEGSIGQREVPFHEKKHYLLTEKEAIALKAASLVEEGDIVGLTGGSTTFLIAKALKQKNNITVVTNAVNIAVELAENDTIQVVVTGGVMRNKSFELCGPLAEKTVEGLNISKMFLGVDGISIQYGLTTYSESEAQINKLLMKNSRQTFAVFDHSKFGKISLFNVASLSALHGVITDNELADEEIMSLRDLKVELYLTENKH
jgi:DeoR family transcriptional regulator, aga operon transcriptional repressor